MVTAAALVLRPHGCRQAALYREPIGDEKLLAGLDIRDRLDVHLSIELDGLAIGNARVVKPARTVAAERTINDAPVG